MKGKSMSTEQQPETASGEASLSRADAQALTASIRTSLNQTWELVVQAWNGRAYKALGYESWDVYCIKEFGSCHLKLPREERAEQVKSMAAAGMSLRAIAAATGLSKDTASRALAAVSNETPGPTRVTGRDGKQYPQHPSYVPVNLDVQPPSGTEKVVTRVGESSTTDLSSAQKQLGEARRLNEAERTKAEDDTNGGNDGSKWQSSFGANHGQRTFGKHVGSVEAYLTSLSGRVANTNLTPNALARLKKCQKLLDDIIKRAEDRLATEAGSAQQAS